MKSRHIISGIKLTGFKSYGDLCRDGIGLGDINVIIGANGSGKSNLISFLEMLAYIANDDLGTYLGKNGFAESVLHFGSKVTQKATGEITLVNENQCSRYQFSLAAGVDGRLYFERENVSCKNEDDEIQYESDLESFAERSGLIARSNEDKSVNDLLSLLKILRVFHFNDTSINSVMRTPTYLHDNAVLRSDAGNISAFLLRMRQENRGYYDRIKNIIHEVFTRFDDFSLNPIHYDGSDDRILLNWTERGIDNVFGPHMLSDGTIRFIALATLLLQPEEGMPEVIILDEPEMGLHPYAINMLSELIRKAAGHSQIILSTQSAALVDCFDVEEVIISEYDPREKSSFLHRPDPEELKEWLNEYSLGELWEKNILGGVPFR